MEIGREINGQERETNMRVDDALLTIVNSDSCRAGQRFMQTDRWAYSQPHTQNVR